MTSTLFGDPFPPPPGCTECDQPGDEVARYWNQPLCRVHITQALDKLRNSQPRPTDPNYPMYPHLSDAGAEEAQALVEAFRTRIRKVINDEVEEVFGKLYVDIVPHIESDSWTNYRNAMMDGFRGYTQNRLVTHEYDFKAIRDKIFSEHREAILADINNDHLERIKDLETELSRTRDMLKEARDRWR